MVQKWSKIRYRPARKRETVCSSRFDPRKRRRHSVEQILNPLQSFIFFSLSLCVRACVRACVCVFRESIYVYVSFSLSLSALYRLRLSPSSVVDDDEEMNVPSNSSKTRS